MAPQHRRRPSANPPVVSNGSRAPGDATSTRAGAASAGGSASRTDDDSERTSRDGSRTRTGESSEAPSRPDGSSESQSLLTESGSLDERAVKDAALPVLNRWTRDRTIDGVQKRVRRLFYASALVTLVGAVTDPPGLTGFVLQAWWLASLPITAVTAGVYATVRDPSAARDVWWERGLLATVGLVATAVLVRAGTTSAAGRVAWQLLFADDSPTGVDYGYASGDDDVDDAQVQDLHRWVRFLVGGSLAVVLVDGATSVWGREITAVVLALLADQGASGGGDAPAVIDLVPTDPLAYALLVAAVAVVGAIVGFFVAVRRDL